MRKSSPIKKSLKTLPQVIVLGYFLFIILLGISYSYFSTTLKINGVATLVQEEWPDGILPAEPVKPETGTGSQISRSFQSEYLTGTEISSTAQAKFGSVTETYDTASSTYTINITKTATNGNAARPIENFNLNFQIQNTSNVT